MARLLQFAGCRPEMEGCPIYTVPIQAWLKSRLHLRGPWGLARRGGLDPSHPALVTCKMLKLNHAPIQGENVMQTDPVYTVVPMTIASTVFLILAIVVILARSRTTEMKLLLIGVFMAIAASVDANVTGVSINAAQVALSTGLGSAALMKISVILTLAGVGMLLLQRVSPPATTATQTEHPHVD